MSNKAPTDNSSEPGDDKKKKDFSWNTSGNTSSKAVLDKSKDQSSMSSHRTTLPTNNVLPVFQFQTQLQTRLPNEQNHDIMSDFSLAFKIQTELNNEWQENEKKMLSTISGKAFMFVNKAIRLHEHIQEAVGRAKHKTLSYPLFSDDQRSLISQITTVATDDLVWLTEEMLKKQHELINTRSGAFSSKGSSIVDIGYHYTRASNLSNIRTDGLLTKAERSTRNINSKYNGSKFGDGVYTANDPLSYAHFGDVGLIVARIRGITTTDPSDTTSAHSYVNERLSMTVLRSSSLCVPIIQFPTRLVKHGEIVQKFGRSIISKYHKMLQKLVDKMFNEGASEAFYVPPTNFIQMLQPTGTLQVQHKASKVIPPSGFNPPSAVNQATPSQLVGTSSMQIGAGYFSPNFAASGAMVAQTPFGTSGGHPLCPWVPSNFLPTTSRSHQLFVNPPFSGTTNGSLSTLSASQPPTVPPQGYDGFGNTNSMNTSTAKHSSSFSTNPTMSQPILSTNANNSHVSNMHTSTNATSFTFSSSSSTAASASSTFTWNQSTPFPSTISSISAIGPSKTGSFRSVQALDSKGFGSATYSSKKASSSPFAFNCMGTSNGKQTVASISDTLLYKAPTVLTPPTSNLDSKVEFVIDNPFKDEECPICLSELFGVSDDTDHVVALTGCQHEFHYLCIKEALHHDVAKRCPCCLRQVLEPQGHMPSGTMRIKRHPTRDDIVNIEYAFPGGTQKSYHCNPGKTFEGAYRKAYVPNTAEGRNLLKRLKYAFMHGLTFSVGTSLTSGRSNQVTWSSIHHKTSLKPSESHSLPDPTYITSCNKELDALGVPESQDL